MRLPLARLAVLTGALLLAGEARAWSVAGEWVASHNSRVRLIAAPAAYADGAMKLTAGVEIVLEPGWKTYWRNPGDAGGVPPEFDWTKSVNVASATVLYPAPARLVDPLGNSIGYKHVVLFPVTVVPADPNKPLMLDVRLMYGVCEKICIPEEHELTLKVDPAVASDASVGDAIARALASVPVAQGTNPGVPQYIGLTTDGTGLIIDTQFPDGTSDAQVFAEALDSAFVPMSDRLAGTGDGHTRFRIDLKKSDDLKAPSGRKLRLTLVGDDTASEVTATIP